MSFKRLQNTVWVLLISFLSGCATGALGEAENPGLVDRFTLNTGLVVRDRAARAYIQHGRPVTYADIDRYMPYCSVEIKTLPASGEEFRILPGNFVIRKYRRFSDPPMGAATMSLPRLYHEIGPIDYTLEFFLHSSVQLEVIRLRCNRTVDEPFSHDISLSEVRQALGASGSIN